jgi:hypothetical protein
MDHQVRTSGIGSEGIVLLHLHVTKPTCLYHVPLAFVGDANLMVLTTLRAIETFTGVDREGPTGDQLRAFV